MLMPRFHGRSWDLQCCTPQSRYSSRDLACFAPGQGIFRPCVRWISASALCGMTFPWSSPWSAFTPACFWALWGIGGEAINQAPARNLLLPAAGFATWGVGFAAIYGLQAVGCAAGWNDLMAGPLSLQRVLLIVLLLAV